MKKESMTVFDVIDEVNQDLGEDLVAAYKSENGNWPIYAKVREIKLVGGFATKQLCYEYEIIKSKQKVEMLKKQVLSMFLYNEISLINPYEQILQKAKNNIAKKRNVLDLIEYLKNRYNLEFGNYSCTKLGSATACGYVIFPRIECKWMKDFKFCRYFVFYFDGNEISKKSIKSYCRKMDKVINRIKCIYKAFGNEEISLNLKNFYGQCEIKKSGFGDWIIKFPYSQKGKNLYVGSISSNDTSWLLKIMQMCHYKDTNYCIWRASTAEEFETMRELMK